MRNGPTIGERLGVQKKGVLGTVVSGPVKKGAHVYWQINYDSGVDGWSVETYLEEAPPLKFKEGDTVTATNRLVVRESAGGAKLGVQKQGATGTIVGGPVSKGRYIWYQVDWNTGADGWSAQDFLSLAPTPAGTAASNERLANIANALSIMEAYARRFSFPRK